MGKTELFVSLKVPDNVAITAFHAVERMGIPINGLKRYDYYSFDDSSKQSEFQKKISNVDILVNANKHKYAHEINPEGFTVLVEDIEKDASLLKKLKESFGFTKLKSTRKGTVWAIDVSDRARAKEITEKLLMNEHYQKFRFL